MSLFAKGRNCFAETSVDAAHLVVDTGNYYAEAYEVLRKARHAVYILGWDFHSQISLLPGEEDADPPAELLGLLRAITEKTPDLQIYILVWYANPFYSLDREKFIRFKMLEESFANVHLVFDNELPISASHHQKILVVDDTIAYCGGMDFTDARWDLPEHRPQDERRVKVGGAPYGPYHDVDVRVRGEASRTLGEMFRARWKATTGETLPVPPRVDASAFDDLPWSLPAVPCAVSRTMPAYKDRKEVCETRRMILDLLAAATRHIYIENQYLTSREVTRALCARLRKEDCPTITIVLPRINPQGPGNKLLMMHRNVMLWELRRADKAGKLGIFSPLAEDDGQIYVHTKLLSVDDTYLTVGSSNLTARSLGLDSECDVTFDASGSPEASDALRFWKSRLLAEHAGMSEEEMDALLRDDLADLHHVISGRPQSGRRLEALESHKPTSLERWMVNVELSDYQQPLLFDFTVDAVRKPLLWARHPLLRHAFIVIGTIIGLFFLIAVLLNATPLQSWAEAILTFDTAAVLRESRFDPFIVPLVYVGMGLLCVPMNFLMFATALLFPTVPSLLYIWIGMILSAVVNYGVGMLLGKKILHRFFHRSIAKISAAMEKKEFLSFAILRMIPVAPFGLINVIAGAYGARFFPFITGTFVGILPGSVLLVFFQRTLLGVIANPTTGNVLLLGAYCLLLVTFIRFFKRRL